MRASELFMPTLKEDPADSEAVSHRLLVRGGFVRRFSAGMYIFLPLGWRVMERVNSIMREEMNAIGGQEVSMPTLHPAEVWKETGRYDEIGPEMFRLNDRSDRPMVLAMTHEEIFAWMAGRELRSYRDLPQTWYQIQLKFRDEPRAKGGILRVREFLMKDSYSFDIDEDGLEESYARHAGAYDRILSRCGLDFYRVDSDPGMMGGAQAHEYMAPSAAGEDRVAICRWPPGLHLQQTAPCTHAPEPHPSFRDRYPHGRSPTHTGTGYDHMLRHVWHSSLPDRPRRCRNCMNPSSGILAPAGCHPWLWAHHGTSIESGTTFAEDPDRSAAPAPPSMRRSPHESWPEPWGGRSDHSAGTSPDLSRHTSQSLSRPQRDGA